jgi:hypothetical protein
LQVGKDCADTNIELSLWHIGASFDPSKFYAKLLVVDEDEASDDRITGAGSKGFAEARAGINIRKRFVKKRALFKGMMGLGLGLQGGGHELNFGVQFYKLVKKAVRPQKITLHAGTNEPVKSTSLIIDAADGSEVAAADVISCVSVGGTSFQYGKADKVECLRAVNSSSVPSTAGAGSGADGHSSQHDHVALRVHFFTPISALPLELSLEASIFVVPFEGEMSGSNAPFVALLKHLASKKLMAVGSFARTAESLMRPCVVLPQEEVFDDVEQQQVVPPGFNVVLLPFRNEVRFFSGAKPSADMHATSLQPGVASAADALVRQLALPSNSAQPLYTTIENPALQQFFSVLQAIALSESEAASWSRDQDQMTRRHLVAAAGAGDSAVSDGGGERMLLEAANAFKESLALPDDAVALMNGKKRKAAGDGGGSGGAGGGLSKKPKKEVPCPVDEAQLGEWKQAFSNGGDGPGMTNDALTDVCRALGVAVSGKKELLVGRIVDKLNRM